MAISAVVKQLMAQASWIRRMFEEGIELKTRFGEDRVFDFSLGNPDLDPPPAFLETLERIVAERKKGKHGYMPNAGYPETRQVIAEYLSREHEIGLSKEQVIMSCGAGGGLNVVLKTLLNQGEEIIILVPYFAEYLFYVSNHGGVCRLVSTHDDFSLDLARIADALSPKTKAIIVNSPHNPTGKVYDEESMRGLGELLRTKSRELKRTMYLISDEPYRKIIYDGTHLPSVFRAYEQSILVTSYSKELSIPGERIGFIAVNPQATPLDDLIAGIIFCNRTLGFVNAPALMQRVVQHLQGVTVDVGIYQRRRDLLCENLASFGYRFVEPQGAFYLFPQSPLDDLTFVRELQSKNILAVPGRGFGMPGFFRIAYCVDEKVIRGSLRGFKEVAEKYLVNRK